MTIWERTDNDGHADCGYKKSVAGYYGPNPGPVERARIVEEDEKNGAGDFLTPDSAKGDEAQRILVDKIVQWPRDGKPIRVRNATKPPFGDWVEVPE